MPGRTAEPTSNSQKRRYQRNPGYLASKKLNRVLIHSKPGFRLCQMQTAHAATAKKCTLLRSSVPPCVILSKRSPGLIS